MIQFIKKSYLGIIHWIKPEDVTWRDWWASRTNKAISAATAVYLAAMSGTVSLTDLGVPENWASYFLSAMGLITAIGFFKLRTATKEPLKGRHRRDHEHTSRDS